MQTAFTPKSSAAACLKWISRQNLVVVSVPEMAALLGVPALALVVVPVAEMAAVLGVPAAALVVVPVP
jgi:hypothetical protein